MKRSGVKWNKNIIILFDSNTFHHILFDSIIFQTIQTIKITTISLIRNTHNHTYYNKENKITVFIRKPYGISFCHSDLNQNNWGWKKLNIPLYSIKKKIQTNHNQSLFT